MLRRLSFRPTLAALAATTVLLAGSVLSGCGSEPDKTSTSSTEATPSGAKPAPPKKVAQPASSPFPTLNIQKLAGRSPAQVAAVIGKPRQIDPIKSYPNQMPGEHRKYKVGRNGEMSIRFYRGRAVLFTWYFDEDEKEGAPTPEAAVAALGVDVAASTPDVTAPAGVWWKGSHNGIKFARIGATKTSLDTSVWGCVQAELQGTPH